VSRERFYSLLFSHLKAAAAAFPSMKAVKKDEKNAAIKTK
jgi:hypothetical protein